MRITDKQPTLTNDGELNDRNYDTFHVYATNVIKIIVVYINSKYNIYIYISIFYPFLQKKSCAQ